MADREIKKGRREMGKRAEVEEAERLLLIKECLAKRMRIREAARRAGVHPSTIEKWISHSFSYRVQLDCHRLHPEIPKLLALLFCNS